MSVNGAIAKAKRGPVKAQVFALAGLLAQGDVIVRRIGFDEGRSNVERDQVGGRRGIGRHGIALGVARDDEGIPFDNRANQDGIGVFDDNLRRALGRIGVELELDDGG